MLPGGVHATCKGMGGIETMETQTTINSTVAATLQPYCGIESLVSSRIPLHLTEADGDDAARAAVGEVLLKDGEPAGSSSMPMSNVTTHVAHCCMLGRSTPLRQACRGTDPGASVIG